MECLARFAGGLVFGSLCSPSGFSVANTTRPLRRGFATCFVDGEEDGFSPGEHIGAGSEMMLPDAEIEVFASFF